MRQEIAYFKLVIQPIMTLKYNVLVASPVLISLEFFLP